MGYKDPVRQRAYVRDWAARRRAAFFADKVCVRCSSDSSLELHHRDPSQKRASAIWTWSEARRLEEIAKCDVLCETCHIAEHREARRIRATFRERDFAGRFVVIRNKAAA